MTLLIGALRDSVVHVDLWLMSCRVLKRDVELALCDELVRVSRLMGARAVRGTYTPTPKNGLVAGHYERLGFTRAAQIDGRSEWMLDISGPYQIKNKHIEESRRG